MKKILVVTDFDSTGSGYRNICGPLFTELAREYEIKIIGLANRGEEHSYPFSIIPAQSVEEVKAMAGNLIQLWFPDVMVVALDLALQDPLIQHFKQQFKVKYIAITPLENGQLVLDWAAPLFSIDGVFFISELGKQEALKVGVKAEHLQIGVDTVSWRPAFPEEKKKLRDGLGIPQDAFVILTVADNQERKNLWAGFRAVRHLKKKIDRPIKYILVTREHSPFGYKLRSLSVTEGIQQEYTPFERGMPQQDLWALYAVSDVYLQPSKAEGLGLPVMDAMCCKIPVVATKTGALVELLENERGWLIDGYTFDDEEDENFFIDVWGNSSRVMINIHDLWCTLWQISEGNIAFNPVEPAYEFIKQRTWDIPAKQLTKKIEEICNEPKTNSQL